MYYGDEKNKEMMRSILPSKKAKAARRQKRRLNRNLRHNAKQALDFISNEEDWDNSDFDFWDDAQHERAYIVQNRRDADKLSHFLRWAEVKAKDIPDGEKMGYIKSILSGRGLIFDHACSHLEYLDGFDNNDYGWKYYWRRRKKAIISRDDLVLFLKKICEVRKYHSYLNDALRSYHKKTYQERLLRVEEYLYYDQVCVDGVPVNVGEPKLMVNYHTKSIETTVSPRILMGIDDIENFVNDILYASKCDQIIRKKGFLYNKLVSGHYSFDRKYEGKVGYTINPDYHPEWLRVLKFFVEDFIKDPKKLKEFNVLIPTKVRKNKWNRLLKKEEGVDAIELRERWYSYDWKL